jgi:hypothetical protein
MNELKNKYITLTAIIGVFGVLCAFPYMYPMTLVILATGATMLAIRFHEVKPYVKIRA